MIDLNQAIFLLIIISLFADLSYYIHQHFIIALFWILISYSQRLQLLKNDFRSLFWKSGFFNYSLYSQFKYLFWLCWLYILLFLSFDFISEILSEENHLSLLIIIEKSVFLLYLFLGTAHLRLERKLSNLFYF
jgi:hypothetical protein